MWGREREMMKVNNYQRPPALLFLCVRFYLTSPPRPSPSCFLRATFFQQKVNTTKTFHEMADVRPRLGETRL